MPVMALLILLAGPLDKYASVVTLEFNTGNRAVSYRQGFEGRSFYVKVAGRPYPAFFTDEVPKWLGAWRIVPLSGPAFEFELVFPHQYFEIRVRRTASGLAVTFGRLRPEYVAKDMARSFLAQKLPLPEVRLMKPFPRIERLIARRRFEQAKRILEELPIGYGNGLRGLRLGDLQLLEGKIATAVRSYKGVVQRFGNLYFAALTRTRLIAVQALIYRKFPAMNSLDGTLQSIRPKSLQELARRKVALAYEGVNKLTEALHILEPLGMAAGRMRQHIVSSLIKYSLVSGEYAQVGVYATRYADILRHHPRRIILDMYVAESFLAMHRPEAVIPLLQQDLKLLGKWKKGDPLAERGFAYLAQAFCMAGRWLQCEGSTRYYLENRRKGAPHEGVMWEWYASALEHKGVHDKAHVFYLTAIRSFWNESRAVSLALRLAHDSVESRPRWALDYLDAMLRLNPDPKDAEHAVLIAYRALQKLGNIDRAPIYFAYLRHPSARVLVRHSELLARMGDVGKELLFLEAASTMNGPWAEIALARLQYLRDREQFMKVGKDHALESGRR